jgi:hypothetical protein
MGKNMPRHTAMVEQEYAGRQIKVGEAFDVEPIHVQLLSMLGRIDPKEASYEARDIRAGNAPEYSTRAMTAARPKRAYNRKAA